MKKLLSILLILVLFVLSAAVSVSAYDPLPPDEHVAYLFKDFYERNTDGGVLANVECIEMSECPGSVFGNEYFLIRFTSQDAKNEIYLNCFGVDNEYYERSSVTNKVFGSGIAVFLGSVYNSEDIDNFLSLSDIALMNPAAIDYISELIGVECVGKIGDVDGDNSVTVLDATEIQRHLAELVTIESNRLNVADVNQDEDVNIVDATVIQRKLAKLYKWS